MIELSDIQKRYELGGEVLMALDHVDLTVGDHEYVAIIGPSGSGKSTLMNIIGCLDTADGGTYKLDGLDITRYSQRQLAAIRGHKIGFIFQQFNLLQKLTAYENVELPLIYQGIGAAERRLRVGEALERVGLGSRMHHRPNQLSGGQQQRVAVARAVVTRPSLILADEPTGNLDSKTTVEIMDMLEELHAQGNAIVLITHNPEIAARAPRCVHIRDGRLSELAPGADRRKTVEGGAGA
ncbi:ATP-binding cassette domain-containing protein [Beduinella massiliensis]|uniref:ATP-binding cassette domain-containing protein n=1 Tax=Beduinella massiliensis TaxID=1852363 RepID=UPI000C82C4FE